MNLEELKSALWEAAQLLRGSIDAGGYKEYIFPLVFFKRICDVHKEEYERALAETGDEDFARNAPENYTFAIPEGCDWEDVRNVTTNVGQALTTAWVRIEQANPSRIVGGRRVEGLEGIFGNSGIWRNKNILTDETITGLIENFSKLDLSIKACPADEMGKAYEYLVGKFADDAGNTAQEFYTNRTVVELMVDILEPKAQESIYDPTCGTGGMLISCIAKLKDPSNPNDNSWREVRAYGQELKPLTATIARMNLFLHGLEEFRIVKDDTLVHPAFTTGGKLQTFDVVLANPPYGLGQDLWSQAAFEHDPYGRNFLGTPPASRADYAFIQHILKSMDEKTGRCAILLPLGDLDRESETKIRENLVKSDLLEAVIGLGPNLFYNSPMEACIMICRSKKSAAAKGRVLFINAVKEVTRKNGESYLERGHIQKIIDAYRKRHSDGTFSYDATNAEIAAINYNLNISRYAHQSIVETGSKVSLADAFAGWQESDSTVAGALDEILDAMR